MKIYPQYALPSNQPAPSAAANTENSGLIRDLSINMMRQEPAVMTGFLLICSTILVSLFNKTWKLLPLFGLPSILLFIYGIVSGSIKNQNTNSNVHESKEENPNIVDNLVYSSCYIG